MTVNTIVYSAQFKDEDYFGSRSLFFFLFRRGSGDELYDTRSRKRRLKPDAVPTIFFFFFASEGRVVIDHRRLFAVE